MRYSRFWLLLEKLSIPDNLFLYYLNTSKLKAKILKRILDDIK